MEQPGSAAPSDELLVADSFRVRVHDGRAEVRGLSHHIGRFSWSAHLATAGELAGVGNFLDEARFRIAVHGAGFPRWELWRRASDAGFELRLSLRPLPELSEAIELRSASGVELEHPERKGPNIARLAELNHELGAEALLLDADGRAVEGATTAILWWVDGELRTSSARSRVTSVAEALAVEVAQAAGIPVRSALATPEELTVREVWAVNALHGIRPVGSIDGTPLPEPEPHRLARFRDAFDGTWQAVAPPELHIK